MRAWIVLSLCLLIPDIGVAESWETVRDRVDALIDARLRADGIEPGPEAAESALLRRTYLDLTGVIPTVGEVREHFADTAERRHERLVDRLIGNAAAQRPPSPRHATHLANHWRTALLPDTDNQLVLARASQFETWLRERFAANTSYDTIARDLLTAEGNLGQSGPVVFYAALESKPEQLAASTARSFLGLQIECAQCHDHPFDRWTQRDFWGMAAFFGQLRRGGSVPGRIVNAVADADDGEVELPNGEIVPPKFLGDESPLDDDPMTSRRARFAEWVVARENPYFARAAANRAWALLFGYGLVDPVDDFGAHNAPSHPQVLDLLAADFAEYGYDLQRTLRILANTRTYARTSIVRDGEEYEPRSYARMPVKSLTGEQVYDAISRATLKQPTAVSNNIYAGFGRGIDASRTAFLAKFRGAPSTTEFQGGIPRTLTIMNGAFVAERTDLARSDLLIAVAESPFLDDAAAVETLFLATLSREPSSSERERFVTHVESRDAAVDRGQPLADVLWALLNSGEFLLNH